MADIIGLDGKRAEKAKEDPKPRWIEFVLLPRDGEAPEMIREFGFLIIGPGYLGIQNEQDKLTLMIPSDNVYYIRASDEVSDEETS